MENMYPTINVLHSMLVTMPTICFRDIPYIYQGFEVVVAMDVMLLLVLYSREQ